MKRAILIGDSIRLGYQAAVADELAGVFEVVGPAENGGTTRRVLEHLDEWVLRPLEGVADAAVVHLNAGLHDTAHKDLTTGEPIDRPNVPLEEYKDNVERILTAVLERGGVPASRVIWALTTPVNEAWHQRTKPFVRREADVENYNRVASSVARRLGVRINDLHGFVMAQGRDGMLLEDGVHYTEAGYILLGEKVAEAIRNAADA